MDELLQLLKENALESPENLARMLAMDVEQVKEQIAEYENSGIIRGYQAIVDEDQLKIDKVKAVIEVKIVPHRDGGFDKVARRISRFAEVESLYLMSGTYDLLLIVEGESLQKVANFVSARLSTIKGVTSTATHFMLKAYKQHNILMEKEDQHERLQITP